jgi:isopentenyldiphosphate isomerase/2-polyprenyl-3-methyl-5-hydroxy-6-metoxy-1,4-benzoquinol methylase
LTRNKFIYTRTLRIALINSSDSHNQMAAAEEQFDIFDAENASPVGRVSRSVVHQTGLLHRGVHIVIFRRSGGEAGGRDLLLQLRADDRDVCPGRWDLSCGEHLTPGESYADAAARGLREELGLDEGKTKPKLRCVQPPRLLERAFDSDGNEVSQLVFPPTDSSAPPSLSFQQPKNVDVAKVDREFDACYVLEDYSLAEHGQVAADDDEVSQIKWVSEEEVTKLLADTPDKFTPWCRDELRGLGLAFASGQPGGGSSSDVLQGQPEGVRRPVSQLSDQVRAADQILRQFRAFGASRVVLSAVELGVFTELKSDAVRGDELVRAVGLHYVEGSRACWDFLDLLVSLGFLEREGPSGRSGWYSNSSCTRLLLDQSNPSNPYLGDLATLYATRVFPKLVRLTECLRTGKAVPDSAISVGGGEAEVVDGTKDVFSNLFQDEVKLKEFLSAMGNSNLLNFELLASRWTGWKDRVTLCDIGGAAGDLCLAVARLHPHMRCKSMDLAPVIPVAQDFICEAGLQDRVEAVSGDFFAFDRLPDADVITMSNILHDWPEDQKLRLVEKAFASINPGGALIVLDMMIDNERRQISAGLMMSLQMLVEFGDGHAFDYTRTEFERWCSSAGFSRFEYLPLVGSTVAGIAFKRP